MKKISLILSVVILVLVSSVVLVGCGSSGNRWIDVQSVSWDGGTFVSRAVMKFDSIGQVQTYTIAGNTNIHLYLRDEWELQPVAVNRDRGFSFTNGLQVGDIFYLGRLYHPTVHKLKLISHEVQLISIRIHDSRKISIRQHDGIINTVISENFTIQHFN